MISCSDAVRLLWDYLDDAVGAEDGAAIQEHLSVCMRCCGEAEFAGELRKFLAGHATQDLPPAVRRRLLAAIDDL